MMINHMHNEERNELTFYRLISNSLPVVVYLNEILKDGDPLTCRNVWTNRFGLDYIGYSQEEVWEMGNEYIKSIVHPDDLNIVPTSLNVMSKTWDIPVFVGMHRIRTKLNPIYKWCYGFSSEIESPATSPFRQILSAVFVISDDMHCMTQLTELLKEVGRLKNELKLAVLSKREIEVLRHIAKGKSDNEIAQILFISHKTAKKHHNNILQKLSLHKATELVAFAKESGI